MAKNECPVCKKPLYSKIEFDAEPDENEKERDYQEYALPNWPANAPNRPKPHKDNATRHEVQELDAVRRSVYNRLVVQCNREGCTTSYMIKNRDKHYQ